MSKNPIHAFPFNGVYYRTPGMELRDLIALHALNGMLANSSTSPFDLDDHQRAIRLSYWIADEMVKERSKAKEEDDDCA